ncbi:MAG TPA: SIMPL domain-containing protein [Tepidisphaeraceae bacterium]|jgi:hypothetical protein|nr:SIMPL domain-containing protein [Tepidisphaeraceae bacterium]
MSSQENKIAPNIWRAMGMMSVMLASMWLVLPAARAQDNSGITVSGSGKASGKPTVIEIPCIVSGDAELTADALVKYRDARKHAVDAIDGLKIPGLSVESKGYSIKDYVDQAAQQQAMMRGQGVVSSKQKISVVEQMKIVIKDADKMDQSTVMDTMLKVLDTVRDAGLTLGDGTVRNVNYYPPPPMPGLINFKIADPSALREQAYKQAMDDARTRAQKLADLAGVKLGRILSVHDGGQKAVGQNPNENEPPQAREPDELVSSTFSEIPLLVKLTVQFEIAK